MKNRLLVWVWPLLVFGVPVGFAIAQSIQPTTITDGTINSRAGLSTVGSAKALKVDVIQTVGSMGSTVTQGPPGTTANAWPVKVTDGTDTALVTAGGLLQVDGSGVTQPVSGTLTCNAGGGTFAVSGTVTSNQGTPASAANRWPVQITDGTDLALVNAGGDLEVDVNAINGFTISTGNGVAGGGTQRVTISSDSTGVLACTQSGTWNVNNVSGTVSLPTGAATEASLAKLTIAQGAALGANTMAMCGASVLASVPAYSAGLIQPLSMDTNGGLRVNMVGIDDKAINAGAGAASDGTQRVILASDQTSIPVTQSGTWTVQPGNTQNTTAWVVQPGEDAAANTTITAATQTVTHAVTRGESVVTFQTTGTWSGTFTAEGTVDGTTWFATRVYSGSDGVLTLTANGIFYVASGGLHSVRLRASSWSSGTAVVYHRGSLGDALVRLNTPLPAGTN